MTKPKQIKKEIKETEERIEKEMEKSRELDQLKGKILSIPVADGRTFYEVKDIKDDLVRLEIRKDLLIDYYELPVLSKSCWIHKRNVEEYIKGQKNMEEIFS